VGGEELLRPAAAAAWVAAALDLSGAREAGSGSVAPRLSFSGLYILQRLASEGTATGVVLLLSCIGNVRGKKAMAFCGLNSASCGQSLYSLLLVAN
jgi:hypothetical protein